MPTGNRVVSLRLEVNKWKLRQTLRNNLLMVQVVPHFRHNAESQSTKRGCEMI